MKTQTIKYFVYCRKSSEDATKQVASIQDQENALLSIVEKEKLNVVKTFREERSSKDPGRPIFNEMLDRVDKGEANGILCWDIDRLYRNPVDEGRLRWLLQKNVVSVIRTPYRQFYPEDAGLLMGVEGGRATDYVIRLSKNVKRGLNGKVAKGWRPSSAPIGYKNIGERGDRTIIPDPESFETVRKCWDLLLTGVYPVSKILEIATEQWGLRTKIRRKLGGKKPSLSHMYNVFSDPFYYGSFWWNNPETEEKELHKGLHKPMITETEFMRAKALIGKKGKPQPQTREFAFTGLMRCGECDSMITAEAKQQIICTKCKHKFSCINKTICPKCQTDSSEMNNPTILNYVYYHCTKKKNKHCTQKSIKIEDLETEFINKLDRLKIDDEYLNVAIDYLREKKASSGFQNDVAKHSLSKNLEVAEERLNKIEMEYTSRANLDYGIYSPEEYKESKNRIKDEIKGIKENIEKVNQSSGQSSDVTERVFNFCTLARKVFAGDDLKKKKIVCSTIGSNLTLKDKKVFIDLVTPFLLIENEINEQKKLYSTLEPEKRGYDKRKEAVFTASIPTWLRG